MCLTGEWFIRAQSSNVQFKPVDNYLSVYRITGENKTVTGGNVKKKGNSGYL